MATVRVRGALEREVGTSELQHGLGDAVSITHAVRMPAAQVIAAEAIDLPDVEPDDVLEIELEDGIRVWMRTDDAARELGVRARGAATGGDELIELPTTLPLRGGAAGLVGGADGARGMGTRGVRGFDLGAFAIKALKILRLDRSVAENISAFAAKKVEGRLSPGPGIYRCNATAAPTDSRALTRLDDPGDGGPALSGGPVLIFLHGTASSTQGAFAGLWTPPDPVMAQVVRRYDGRVLGFQHASLTKSPIENALELMTQLRPFVAAGTELHLVAHSRGGLIGELISRGMRQGAAPFTAEEIALFDSDDRRADHKAIQALNAELGRAAYRVTKFVRVACPARGTTLADERLDRYFSILTNVIGWIPLLRASGIYDAVTSLLGAILKTRAQPKDLPGLEAMMPGSPLVRILNQDRVTLDADLHILGGDLEGEGLAGRLKTLATDAFFREDHDLVVNTVAMLGGARRTQPVKYWIDTGNEVTHFHYFTRPDTSRRLFAALSGLDRDFRTLEVAPSAVTAKDYQKRASLQMTPGQPGLQQPRLVVVPSLMGSELSATEQAGSAGANSNRTRIWIDRAALATEDAWSRLASDKLEATGVLASAYGDLCRFLSATHDVTPFAYDWRQSLDASAEQLRITIAALLDRSTTQPVRILAHGTGGLVVRAMLTTPDGQETWTRMCGHAGARLVLLGTPLDGAYGIAGLLLGQDPLIAYLSVLGLASRELVIRQTFAGCEGVLAALPDGVDIDAPAAALKRVRDLRKKMARVSFDRSRTVYVAGVAPETPVGLSEENGTRTLMATARGDGRTPWATIPSDLTTFTLDAPHGNLCRTESAFGALHDLLNTGTTTQLLRGVPRGQTADDLFPARKARAQMIPDEEELAIAALAGTRARKRDEDRGPRVRVRVIHDNLKNADAPVLVGHYVEDLIVGTEAYLNARLKGRLAELHLMDLYPGRINTCVPVLNEAEGERGWHPGAIVAGLGRVGELTPGGLVTTLAHALTTYGSDCVGRERRRRARERIEGGALPQRVSAPVTTILVGSGDGGLTVENSVQALLRAVAAANERLRRPATAATQRREPLWAHIDQLDIVELYEDRAIAAAYALRNVARSPDLADFTIHDVLVSGAEGQRRPNSGASAEWWQRVRVTREAGSLRFEALTQSARATAVLQPVERRAVERFVEQVLASTSGERTTGETLFELLVPNDFKAHAPDQRKLVLVMDEASAALPWELMQDRRESRGRPMSVASGMVRQLLLKDAPRRPATRATEATALVIGNPFIEDEKHFPALPAAEDEANAVAARLGEAGYLVTPLLGREATPNAVISSLLVHDWRILHVAGHGVFEHVPEEREEAVSGLVLDGGQFVTAAIAGQMRVVPELVFLNCCHLGNTSGDAAMAADARRRKFPQLAANLGTEFIRMGARAVIAAGWEVNDAAAKTFAHAFYDEMFAGNVFGDAVLRARERTYAAHPATNTWGAYQCYGDPSFALAAVTPRTSRGGPVASAELIAWAEEIGSQANGADDPRRTRLQGELGRGVASAPAEWLDDPRVCAAVATAFGELTCYTEALGYYDRLTRFERADLPLRTIEQLANFRVRYAGDPNTDAEEAARQLGLARTLLEHLVGIGGTVERWSMVGALEKRQALRAPRAADRRRALEQMRDAYEKAYTLALDQQGTAAAYPLENLIAASIALNWRTTKAIASKGRKQIAANLDRLSDFARQLRQCSTSFFDLIIDMDGLLLKGLAAASPAVPNGDILRAAYDRAAHRGVSPRQRESVVAQIRFFSAMADSKECPGLPKTLAAELTSLADAIGSDAGAP